MILYFGKDETFCITDDTTIYYPGSNSQLLFDGLDSMMFVNDYIKLSLNEEQFHWLKILFENSTYDSSLLYIYEQFPEVLL